MAINATHILELVQRRIATANSSTSAADLDKLLTLAKQVDGSLIRSYDSDGALPDASLTNEKMAFITSTGNIKFNNGRWDTTPAPPPPPPSPPPPPPPPVAYGTASGYHSGGSSDRTAVEKFSFTSNANATDVGTLLQDSRHSAGQSSNEHGYTSGAYNAPLVFNTISKFPFASDGNGTDVGDLTQARGQLRGNMSPSSAGGFGYSSGGRNNGPMLNTIDKFPFASDANATDVGDLTEIIYNMASQNSETHGYISGGRGFNQPNMDVIQKFPFATDGNATDVGNLTVARIGPAGQSSTGNGYTSGGGLDYDVIDKFPFASNANATDVGNLTQGRDDCSGQSSDVSGYTSAWSSTNIIDKFPFASNGNASDVGDLVGTESQGHPQHV